MTFPKSGSGYFVTDVQVIEICQGLCHHHNLTDLRLYLGPIEEHRKIWLGDVENVDDIRLLLAEKTASRAPAALG